MFGRRSASQDTRQRSHYRIGMTGRAMNTEFRKAVVPDEIRSLMAFDRRVFPRPDRFDSAYWNICEPYWMIVDGVRVGCCGFERHVDFRTTYAAMVRILAGEVHCTFA